jgi:hypothetical protein
MATLELVEESVAHWARLYRCTRCAQHWKVDVTVGQDRTTPAAIKLPTAENWIAFDDSLARRELLIRDHGGLSTSLCAWAGCRQLALKGTAVCADHGSRARNE